ncbi:outer membrane beta-barrel protein [Marivirga sp.]|uniref:outer membrane beta-barrel protein n=1 Tax=Marivirga sp. TaxID=2018662 RepID=UPI002D80B364|nr:outer membrane beta-barrel protein [Marivirga sp.]HET8858791.1 outer membrane beta-barrel protein [Marivirga sp.]
MQQIRILLIVVGCFIFANTTFAQSSCVQNLREARNFYDEGKLNELPKLLLKCIDNGFTDEEKVEALRLVTLSYLFNEEQNKAEESFLRLLKIDPEYQIDLDSDPTELVILAENFETDAKFFYGLKFTGSFNFIQILENNDNYNLSSSGTYDPPLGIGVGLFFQYPINDEFSANAEIHYNYRTTLLKRATVTAEGNSSGDHEITEMQQWLELPFLLNYKLPFFNQFLLEATGGPSFHYLLSSELSVRGVGTEIIDLDMINYRNLLNVSAIIGVRGNFKVLGRNYITVEALYQHRFIEEKNENVETEELKLILKDAAYADNQYKGHAFILRLGFRFPRFNPELKK